MTTILTWEHLASISNSTFFLSVVGSLAGAAAGALAAYSIIERQKRRETLLGEIRNTNAAISVAFHICNTGMSFKKQHFQKMHDEYESTRDRILRTMRKAVSEEATVKTQIEFKANMVTLPVLTFPISTLQKQVFEQLSVTGKVLSALASLIGSVFSLNESIARRNELIGHYKTTLPPGSPLMPDLYFGFETPDGHVDKQFPDTLKAIGLYTDDLIFFSKLLCEDLHKYGVDLRRGLRKYSKSNLPKINKIDFSKARELGLLPDESEYQSWLIGFSKST